ncbi:MAG: nuclear transport factor 2 family protein [Nocardioidaceae bacterium]
MAEHPNLALFRRVHDAFNAGDMDALEDLFTEDVTWHTPGRNPLSGRYSGREATLASFARELDLSGGTYKVTVHDVLANDEHTVALLHASAERGFKRLDQSYVLVFHTRDGRIAEAWEAWADQASLDEFWS